MPKGIYKRTKKHCENISKRHKEIGAGKWNKGKIRTPEMRRKYSEGQKKSMTEERKKRISETEKKQWDKIGRKKYKRYIHTTSTYRYKKWRMSVFLRDGFTCQFCETKGYLEAHHIKGWAEYPKLRFKVVNGIALCKECHKLANKIKL